MKSELIKEATKDNYINPKELLDMLLNYRDDFKEIRGCYINEDCGDISFKNITWITIETPEKQNKTVWFNKRSYVDFVLKCKLTQYGLSYMPSIIRVRPILDRIIVKQSEGIKEVAGMKIPDGEKKKPLRGVVVAHGPGWTAPETGHFSPITVKVNDEVMYMEHSASQLEIYGEQYVLIKERDLICIL